MRLPMSPGMYPEEFVQPMRAELTQIGFEELHEAPLRELFALRLPFVAHEHEQDNPAKNSYPNNPSARWNPKLTAFFGILVVVVIFIFVWHLRFQMGPSYHVHPPTATRDL